MLNQFVQVLPELIPWFVLVMVFFGMLMLQWRVINALDQTLARLSPLPVTQARQPATTGPSPAPSTLPPPRTTPPAPAPAPVPRPIPPPAPAPPPSSLIAGPFGLAPSWFQWALHEIGFHEIGNNQGLERYIGLAHAGAEGDPWCAIFMNAALESSGVTGSRSASSQSFRTNPAFVQLAGPCLGAITVFWRGSQSSGLGHVGMYRGEDANHIWTLGGNENDMVQIEALAKSSSSFGLIGYWWPKAVPLPVVRPIIMPTGSPTHVMVAPGGTPSVATQAEDGSGKQTGIIATMFGGQKSAYGGPILDAVPGVALPLHFTGPRPRVRVIGKSSGLFVDCDIVDVGPWNINDPYWTRGARPQSESGTDMTGRKTNKAGIDLTLAAAQAIKVDGKGLVDWEFITNQSAPPSVV